VGLCDRGKKYSLSFAGTGIAQSGSNSNEIIEDIIGELR